ncbi:MAG TPA: SDR family NAD(P)-dependent oxidoreductase [Acidimicrobiales bacterium]|nr:SDR family NAD(P)-dependent oxidoreductase [Acidimicrobiales bacterium]
MSVAIVTGASRGLGRALAIGLADNGWSLVIDARRRPDLERAEHEIRGHLGPGADLVAIDGDVTDPGHRKALADGARALGGVDLLVNNAGILGPSPLPTASRFPLDKLREVVEVNLVAPLGLAQETVGLLRASRGGGRIVFVTSDAAVEPYSGWSGYGAAKAAVEQAAAVLAVEEPELRVWAVDPGDLRTQMHQEAFPGEDISDRPEPHSVVPAFLELVRSDRPSGRIRLADLIVAGAPS